jgi:UDP-2-acetamido-2,6-beta-L-arabino-hexul-4-ose reductase
MKRVGITGQNGFVGLHLYNTLGLHPEEFERIDFQKDFFENPDLMDDFVQKCDVIVHLAAQNRNPDPEVLYNQNVDLVKKLISALNRKKSRTHVLFSSSSQEERDNLYGKSKKEGRRLLAEWANKSGGIFTGMIIPNVFGPFGQPNYNSFIATFCHQLTHGESPKIDTDGEVKLIYVAELVEEVLKQIKSEKTLEFYTVPFTTSIKVSDVLERLENYKISYFENGIVPEIKSNFDLQLFNTFRCYFPMETHYPVKLVQHKDERGVFVEIIRLGIGGQCSFSTTLPGVTRGNHFHMRKIERFAVIKGKALIQLRKIDSEEVFNYDLDGSEPAYVDMPIWYTHNIKNIGDEELLTIFWINEAFNAADSDTYFETV